MLDTALQRIGLLTAMLAGPMTLLSAEFSWLRGALYPMLLFAIGMAVTLFLRMLFDRSIPDALNVAQVKMQGEGPRLSPHVKFSDRNWGILGKECGSAPLIWTRAILVAGVIPLTFVHQWIGTQGLILWFVGAFLSMELSIFHVALSNSKRL